MIAMQSNLDPTQLKEPVEPPNKASFINTARIQLQLLIDRDEGLHKESFYSISRTMLIITEAIRNSSPSVKAWKRVSTTMEGWKIFYQRYNIKNTTEPIKLSQRFVDDFTWMIDYFESKQLNCSSINFAKAIVEVDIRLDKLGPFSQTPLSKSARLFLATAMAAGSVRKF